LFPTYTCAFFLLMGALEGRDLSASITKLTTAFPQTAATGTLFWPAANLITFSLAPQHRIAFLGLANIAWSSFLSMVNSSEPGLTSP
jgi:protein Mpv17